MKKNILLLIAIVFITYTARAQSKGNPSRTVLVEEFSTEGCTYCPEAQSYLQGIADTNEHVIIMVHHAGYGYDQFTIQESVDMIEFYAIANGFAPAAMVDRHYNGLDNDWNDEVEMGPVFSPWEPRGEARIKDRLEQTAFLDVNINGSFNNETNKLELTVSGTFYDDFEDKIALSIWITEDNISSNTQAGANGEWIQNDVVRAVITERLGDEIETSSLNGDTYSGTYSFNIDNSWVAKNLNIIAFVNRKKANIQKREIYNAAGIKLDMLEPLGMTNNTTTNISIYPNPFSNTLTIKNINQATDIVITNIVGQQVMHTTNLENTSTLSTTNLNRGVYFISILQENKVIKVEKLVKN